MFIKPNPQRLEENAAFVVPDPERKDKLPPEGREVNPSLYWTRRLNDGDIVIVDSDKAKGKKHDHTVQTHPK